MRRLSGPLGAATKTGLSEQQRVIVWRKLMSRREKTNIGVERNWIKKAWNTKEIWQLPMGGLCKAGVKRHTNRDEMVTENVIAMGEIIIMVRKRRPLAWANNVLFDSQPFFPKSRKKDWSSIKNLTAVIYELITALQLTSKLLYLFSHLIITGFFSYIWIHSQLLFLFL